jgi:hypothetical protein
MLRDPLRFARLLRTWCSRLQISHAAHQRQPPDLHKRAALGEAAGHSPDPDWVDLHANPNLIGTERP